MIVQLDQDEYAEALESGLIPFLTEVLKEPEIRYRGINSTEEGEFYEIDITRKS